MKRSGPWCQEAYSISSDDSSDSDSDGPGSIMPAQTDKSTLDAAEHKKKQRGLIDYSALSRHGYSGGLSVLKVPPPRVEDREQDWSWSTGKREDLKDAEESYEERENTRAAIAAGEKLVNVKSSLQTDRKDKNMSFTQKEKRKRDLGQASRGKSYVEEEKRLLRDSGVYSGFDS